MLDGNIFLVVESGTITQTIVSDADFATEIGALPFYKGAEIGAEYDPPTLEKQVSVLETENRLLKAQVQALSDRNEFMEDCIAEMATQVYA